jgi:hypothetical protein
MDINQIEAEMNKKNINSPFHFQMKQPVHHDGFNVNGKICRRIYIEDGDAPVALYDIMIPGVDKCVLSEVSEFWIKEGHLKQE